MKTIEYLYHFTKDLVSLKEILRGSFKPSYAKEKIDTNDILVPMVSFSNILLRDTGTDEVIFYGNYAIGFHRNWGISKELNPVIYTYENGILQNSLNAFFYNSIFLKELQEFKLHLEELSKYKITFSSKIWLSNTPKEVVDILDYLSLNYSEELINILANQAQSIYNSNLHILQLTKPYKVYNGSGKEFIAYNDREWRKQYPDLGFIIDEFEYKTWESKAKPHFHEEKYLLKFDIQDVKVILVDSDIEVLEITQHLKNLYGNSVIENLIDNKSLFIGTRDTLIKQNF